MLTNEWHSDLRAGVCEDEEGIIILKYIKLGLTLILM